MNDDVPKFGGLKKLGSTTQDDLKIEPPKANETTSSYDAPPILTVQSSDAEQQTVRQQTLDESAHQAMEGAHHGESVVHPSVADLDQTFDDFSAPSLADLASGGDSFSNEAPASAPTAVNVEPPKEKKSKLKLGKNTQTEASPAPVQAAPVNPCPACATSRAADAVFCLACGYNEKTGQKVAPERGPSSLNLKEDKSVSNSPATPIKRAPNYQLLALYRFIFSGLACAGAVYYAQTELWSQLFGFSESELKDTLTDPQFHITQNYYDLALVFVGGAAAWGGSLLSNLFMKSPYRSYITATLISLVVISVVTVGLMFQTVKKQDKALFAYCEAYLGNIGADFQRLWVDGPEPKEIKEFDCPCHYTGTVTYAGIDDAKPKKTAWQIECSAHDHLIDTSLEITKKKEKKKFQQQAWNVYKNLDFWRSKVYDKVSEKTAE